MTRERINCAYEYLRRAAQQQPALCVVLGSGLGDYADTLEDAQVIDYRDIPGFPQQRCRGTRGGWCWAKSTAYRWRACRVGSTATRATCPLRQ